MGMTIGAAEAAAGASRGNPEMVIGGLKLIGVGAATGAGMIIIF
jgi:hypothetical protein